MKTTTIITLVFLATCLFGTAHGADTIHSADIEEADDTSGQDTNVGAGIKTGHIQNGAVTTAKIGAGAVGAAKIAVGAITGPKIADNAISPSKIGFYSNVIIVDINSGGDFTSPTDALNSITDASSTKRYLVKVMPGVYNLGTGCVQMKQYVDIEGSGENVTLLTGACSPPLGVITMVSHSDLRFMTVENNASARTGAAIYADNASDAKILHVDATAKGGTYNYAVYTVHSGMTMMDVKFTAKGGGWARGMQNDNSTNELSNALVQAYDATDSNTAIHNKHSDLTISQSKIYGLYGAYSTGIYQYSGNLRVYDSIVVGDGGSKESIGIRTTVSNTTKSALIHDSFIRGTTNTVKTAAYNFGSQRTLIFNSQMYGGPVSSTDSSTGTLILKCINSYDENYTFSSTDSCF